MHFAVNPVLSPIASRNNSRIKGIPLIVSLIHGVYKPKAITRRKRIHSAAKRPIDWLSLGSERPFIQLIAGHKRLGEHQDIHPTKRSFGTPLFGHFQNSFRTAIFRMTALSQPEDKSHGNSLHARCDQTQVKYRFASFSH